MTLFESIRTLMCPFDKIEPYVPAKGQILDVGCGHGTFPYLLAKQSRFRNITGIDPSKAKITLAKNNYKKIKNLQFNQKDIFQIKNKHFDSISIIDVLYLFPDSEKLRFLKQARSLLNKKGKLILKVNGKEPYFLYLLVLLEEFLMVSLLKYTHSEYNSKLYFSDKYTYRKLLKQSGFKIEVEKRIRSKGFIPYPAHLLFVAS